MRNNATSHKLTVQPEKDNPEIDPSTLSLKDRLGLNHLDVVMRRQIQHAVDYPHIDPASLLQNPHFWITAGKTLFTSFIEFIPGPEGWGPGDLVTFLEAVAGRTVLLEKLSGVERIFELVASAIPFVPAYPVVQGYRLMRLPIEGALMPKSIRSYAEKLGKDPRTFFLESAQKVIVDIPKSEKNTYQDAILRIANRHFPIVSEDK